MEEIVSSGSTGSPTPSPSSSTSNPIGADVVRPGGVDSSSSLSPQSAEPTEIGDDTLVRVPGQASPIKYGELSKRLQADYTRKTQQAEKLKQQYENEHRTRMGEVQAERKRLEQVAAAVAAARGGNQGGPDPFLADLAKQQYIDGPTAVKLVQNLQQSHRQLGNAITERDKVIQGLYQYVVKLNNTVQGMNGRFSTQDFDGKINKWLSDGGYPPEASQLAKEIYLAYEGDDLDDEFPSLFEARWNQLQQIIRSQQQAKVDAVRRQPALPGRGGNGAPAKMVGLKGHEKARDIAGSLWEAMQADDSGI